MPTTLLLAPLDLKTYVHLWLNVIGTNYWDVETHRNKLEIYTTIGIDGCTLGLDTTSIVPKHTSYKNFVFREFVQNSWGFDMDIVIFDL